MQNSDEPTNCDTQQPADDEPQRPQHDAKERKQHADVAVTTQSWKSKRQRNQKRRPKESNGEA